MSDTRSDFHKRLARLPEREVAPPVYSDTQINQRTLGGVLAPLSYLLSMLVGFGSFLAVPSALLALGILGNGTGGLMGDWAVGTAGIFIVFGVTFGAARLAVAALGWTTPLHYRAATMGVVMGFLLNQVVTASMNEHARGTHPRADLPAVGVARR